MTVKTLAIAVAIALAAGIGIGYFARPQPTVHRVDTDTIAAARIATADVVAKTSQASEQQRTEAPKTKVTTRYQPSACGERQQIAERIVERTGSITTNTSQTAATATESHAAAQERVDEQRRLDLTITPPARPGWAFQVGTEDLLSGNTIRMAQELRLATRRRLFGPAWAEISTKPLHRCDDGRWCPTAGGALGMEF